ATFKAGWHLDLVSQKKVRGFQEAAIFSALYAFSQGQKKVLLRMATGTGKTFTVFQLVWKLFRGDVLPRGHVLFLTDRNNLKEQAWRAFSGFSADDRVLIDKSRIEKRDHLTGKVFFANYQNLAETLDGQKLYEHFPRDFFDLVIVDECHRSGFGDWFSVLEHFGSAFKLGLTATPRNLKLLELSDDDRDALDAEALQRLAWQRRHITEDYFGEAVFTYALSDAIDDGYLVPYTLEKRCTNLDAEGGFEIKGQRYNTSDYEKSIVLPDRTRVIAEDLWEQLRLYKLEHDKTIIFCPTDAHAADVAAQFNRLAARDLPVRAGNAFDSEFPYAVRVTRSERQADKLSRIFSEVSTRWPRIAVTVDLLATGYDAPDVRSVVFLRKVGNPLLYKQMKGRGTRLCEDIDKRYFVLFDYVRSSDLEHTERDEDPDNVLPPPTPKNPASPGSNNPSPQGTPSGAAGDQPAPAPAPASSMGSTTTVIPTVQGLFVEIVQSERFLCFGDGRKVPWDEYAAQSRDAIRETVSGRLDELMALWVERERREEIRRALLEREVYLAALRHVNQLDRHDDVDVLAKVGFDLARVPTRGDRVVRFWDEERDWFAREIEDRTPPAAPNFRERFWDVCMEHYTRFGIEDLEEGRTYKAPHFSLRFGSFVQIVNAYGGAERLRDDLTAVKRHLYVPIAA
ncbi:MAG: DEAD/DEAH box helicase family protein, partial [Polyangiales bacterium]